MFGYSKIGGFLVICASFRTQRIPAQRKTQAIVEYGTTERAYLEQARQTILGGARESMLFCYGSLLKETEPKNIETLRANIPELIDVAG